MWSGARAVCTDAPWNRSSTCAALQVRLCDRRPPIRDTVQVDQIVGGNVAGQPKLANDLLDQLRVISRELHRQAGDALAVQLGQHAGPSLARTPCWLMPDVAGLAAALSKTATRGGCRAEFRTCPDPPSNRPTGRISSLDKTTNMVFSFTDEREHQPWQGTWGSPLGMLRPVKGEATTTHADMGRKLRGALRPNAELSG